MELFIPSILVCVLAAITIFFILPRLSPYILGVLAIVLCGAGVYQHYNMFPYEYQSSNILNSLKDYSPFIMIVALIFGMLVVLMTSFGVSPPSIANIVSPVPNAAQANTPQVNTPKANTPVGTILESLGMNTNQKTKNNQNRPANNKGFMNNLGLGPNNRRPSNSYKTI